MAKGERSINRYGIDSQVDPGYISRLLRGLIDTAPSARVIKKLADAALNDVSVEDMLTAAGYIDIESISSKKKEKSPLSQQLRQWEEVIEEAARYNISPELAADLIRSLGKSMEKAKKGHGS